VGVKECFNCAGPSLFSLERGLETFLDHHYWETSLTERNASEQAGACSYDNSSAS